MNQDQNNKNNQNNNNKNSRMRGVLTLVAWAIVVTVIMNYIGAYSQNTANKSTSHEVKYSQFITLVEEGNAKSVLFRDGVIYVKPVDGYVYTEDETPGSDTKPKSYTNTEDTPLTLFTTALQDDDLLPLLKEHGVEYTGYYKAQMSPLLEFMVLYILPTIIMVGGMVLLFRFISKSGGGIGGIGNVGKSNAKVYMERSTGVTFKDVAGQDEAKESTTPRSTPPSAPSCPRARCWWAPPVPARRCWPRLWPARRGCRSSPSPAPTLWRCS